MANNRPALQTKAYSDWRIDIDYWHKLNEEQTAWLITFLDEYYHDIGEDSPARRDIVTLTLDQSTTLLTPNPERNPSYTQDDYRNTYALAQSTRQRPSDWDDESE